MSGGKTFFVVKVDCCRGQVSQKHLRCLGSASGSFRFRGAMTALTMKIKKGSPFRCARPNFGHGRPCRAGPCGAEWVCEAGLGDGTVAFCTVEPPKPALETRPFCCSRARDSSEARPRWRHSAAVAPWAASSACLPDRCDSLGTAVQSLRSVRQQIDFCVH